MKKPEGGVRKGSLPWYKRPEWRLTEWLKKKLWSGVQGEYIFRCQVCAKFRSARQLSCKACGSQRMWRTTAKTRDLLWVYLTGR